MALRRSRRPPLPRLARLPERRRLPRPARAVHARRAARRRRTRASRWPRRSACSCRALFAAASALPLPPERAQAVMRHARLLRGALLGAMAVWAAWSLALRAAARRPHARRARLGRPAGVPRRSRSCSTRSPPCATWRLRVRSGSAILLGVASAWVLLAEASDRRRVRAQLARELVGVAPADAGRVRRDRRGAPGARRPRSASATSTSTRPPPARAR